MSFSSHALHDNVTGPEGMGRNECLASKFARTVVLALFAPLICASATAQSIAVPGYSLSNLMQFRPGNVSTFPEPLVIDSSGNMYVAEFSPYGSGMVWKISPGGQITTVAGGAIFSSFLGDGGPATNAYITPNAIAVDSAGNLYISDVITNRVRKVDTQGTITTIAGPGFGTQTGLSGDGGPATSATIYEPSGVAVDLAGNVFVAEPNNHRVRKISPNGIITTFAGTGSTAPTGAPVNCACGDGGPATSATVPFPSALAVGPGGDLYIADVRGTRIRKVSAATGVITTIAGSGNAGNNSQCFYYALGDGGPALSAQLGGFGGFDGGVPTGSLTVDASGNVYIADTNGGSIRMISPDGTINLIAGGGIVPKNFACQTFASLPVPNPLSGPVAATSVSLANFGIWGVAVGKGGSVYFTYNYYIWQLTPSTTMTPLPSIVEFDAGAAFTSIDGTGQPSGSVPLGGWMEIFGSYFAATARSWTGADFSGNNAPQSLDGTSVTIGGQKAYVGYISASQINVQVPTNIGTGSQPMIVKTPNGASAAYTVVVNPVQPAILAPAAFSIAGVQYVAALFPDGVTYALPTGAIAGVSSRPAVAGDSITLYGIGFGATTNNIPAGQVAGSQSSIALPVAAYIDGQQATVSYAGLSPGLVGLFQLNIVVPKLQYANPKAVELLITLGQTPRSSAPSVSRLFLSVH